MMHRRFEEPAGPTGRGFGTENRETLDFNEIMFAPVTRPCFRPLPPTLSTFFHRFFVSRHSPNTFFFYTSVLALKYAIRQALRPQDILESDVSPFSLFVVIYLLLLLDDVHFKCNIINCK